MIRQVAASISDSVFDQITLVLACYYLIKKRTWFASTIMSCL